MNIDSRKMILEEATLNVNNEETLIKIEEVLNKSTSLNKKQNIFDFVGIISEEEAIEMTKIINATCEYINPDDWK